jgi:hypothetical protein
VCLLVNCKVFSKKKKIVNCKVYVNKNAGVIFISFVYNYSLPDILPLLRIATIK